MRWLSDLVNDFANYLGSGDSWQSIREDRAEADEASRVWRDYPGSDLPRIDTSNAPFHLPPDIEGRG